MFRKFNPWRLLKQVKHDIKKATVETFITLPFLLAFWDGASGHRGSWVCHCDQMTGSCFQAKLVNRVNSSPENCLKEAHLNSLRLSRENSQPSWCRKTSDWEWWWFRSTREASRSANRECWNCRRTKTKASGESCGRDADGKTPAKKPVARLSCCWVDERAMTFSFCPPNFCSTRNSFCTWRSAPVERNDIPN